MIRGASVDIGRISAPIAGIDVVSSSCCPWAKSQLKRAIKNGDQVSIPIHRCHPPQLSGLPFVGSYRISYQNLAVF